MRASFTFIAQCGKLKYTWSKKRQKESGNQALQRWQVSFPEEGKLLQPHLKEALTTLPLIGCGGRQFPTRGTGGSFSALERRLRSLAICKRKRECCQHDIGPSVTHGDKELEITGFLITATKPSDLSPTFSLE